MSDEVGAERSTLPANTRAELGVLLVHGIGRQRQGEVVGEIGRALVTWLHARLPQENSTVRIADAVLRPEARGLESPAEVRLVVEAAAGDRHAVLLRESLWAGEFDPPPAVQVLRWIMGPGAWLLLNHLLDTVRRAMHRWGWRLPADLAEIAHHVRALLGVVLMFLVIMPVQLIGLVLWLASLIPLETVRQRLRGLFLLASELIGDSYAFTRDPLMQAAVAGRVAMDLEALEAVADKVIIVAHSQGAAVAVEMLNRGQPKQTALRLVTYGAGLRKLHLLQERPGERSRVPRTFAWLWLLAILWVTSLPLVAADFMRGVAALPGESVAPEPLYILGGWLFLAVYFACYWVVRETEATDRTIDEGLCPLIERLLDGGIRWLDLWASHDPVPAGPLLVTAAPAAGTAEPGPRFQSLMVYAEASTLFDHNAYWRSFDDFVTRLMGWVRLETGYDWLPAPPADLARPPRGRAALAWGRRVAVWAIMGLALVMLVSLADVWRPWLAALQAVWLPDPLVQALPAVVVWLAQSLVALALHGAAAFAYLAFLIDPLWRRLSRRLALEPVASLAARAAIAVRLGLLLGLVVLPLYAGQAAIEAGRYGPLLDAPLEQLLVLVDTVARWLR